MASTSAATPMYTDEQVRSLAGCTAAGMAHWQAVLGAGSAERLLTRHEAIAIVAVEHVRSPSRPRTGMDRVFARLAFDPPEDGDWLLVRDRLDTLIVEAPFAHDLEWRRSFRGAVFDPEPGAAELDGLGAPSPGPTD